MILILAEGISAAISFILVKFMIAPYKATGRSRYLGLPIGFAFLGASYIFMGASLALGDPSIVEKTQWLKLLTSAYGFTFIAVTYYFSAKGQEQKIHLLMQASISLMLIILAFICAFFFLPPLFELPTYKNADEYFRLLNTILCIYITFHTLRSHASQPEAKTILAPMGYALLGFAQYSLLVWSLDSSYSAFIGAHILRFAGLLIFLSVAYRAMISPPKKDR